VRTREYRAQLIWTRNGSARLALHLYIIFPDITCAVYTY